MLCIALLEPGPYSQRVTPSGFAVTKHLVRRYRIGELLGTREIQSIGSHCEVLRDIVGEARIELTIRCEVQRQAVSAVRQLQELVAPRPGNARLQAVLLVEAHRAV